MYHQPSLTLRIGWIALIAVVCGSEWAAAQMTWTDIAIRYRQDCTHDLHARWTLCGLFYASQSDPAPDGGPQALEGYTVVQHDVGTVALAIGTIGNVELAGAGRTKEARSLQAGGVITGSGVTERWVGLAISQPQPADGATGRIERREYVAFDNGWSIRPDGARLLICDPQSQCRAF